MNKSKTEKFKELLNWRDGKNTTDLIVDKIIKILAEPDEEPKEETQEEFVERCRTWTKKAIESLNENPEWEDITDRITLTKITKPSEYFYIKLFDKKDYVGYITPSEINVGNKNGKYGFKIDCSIGGWKIFKKVKKKEAKQ